MRTFLIWLVCNVPLGKFGAWLLGAAIGRVPHEVEGEDMSHGMKEWLVPSSCLGCAIRIVAFKRERDSISDDSIYITLLSDHAHLYQNSWKGRLYFAWRALKGEVPSDIDLDLPEDIDAFKRAMDEVYEWLAVDTPRFRI